MAESKDTKVLVIEFGRESYVQTQYYYATAENLIINGKRGWPKANGDESFLVVTGKVKSVARYNAPLTITTKYQLREDLICAAKPTWLTPDEFQKLPEADRAIYTPVRETREQAPTPLECRVVDGKAAPRKLPHGITPILPAHVNTYPWFWWTLPCQASREYVFETLVKRLEALDPAQFAVTVYSNIKHIRVDAHAITLGGVSYRPHTSLLHIDRDDRDKVCPAINGENADDVIAKVEAWCDEKMRAIKAAMEVKDCPCCGRELPKGKKRITGRDPGRYRIAPRHDISRN